jgi:hypothetical protein
MDILITNAGREVSRWSPDVGRIPIPDTVGDVVFVRGVVRPVPIGPGHTLVTAVNDDATLSANQKLGPEVVIVNARRKAVTLKRAAIPKTSEDRDGERRLLYDQAVDEYVRRSLVVAEAVSAGAGKVRGGTASERLTALSIKATARGQGDMLAALADVHDSLETLQAKIERARSSAALAALNISDDSHWN